MNDHSLQRFLEAQLNTYDTALCEIKSGRKLSHWMWFIFPQLKGLGRSCTAQFYGIEDFEEARLYLQHPILGKRLKEITSVLLTQPNSNAHAVFGSPDDLKLHSSLTLFAHVSEKENSVFHEALTRFFEGKFDVNTLQLLQEV